MTYELDLPDGRTLRTRISHPPDRTDYGANLFAILRDELAVSEKEFWACVREGVPPDRGGPLFGVDPRGPHYARGEIDDDEYRRRLDTVRGAAPTASR